MIVRSNRQRLLSRAALLGGAITASTFLAAAPAQAACTISPAATPVTGTVTCATTTTTDTTYAGVSPASDRNYSVSTATSAFTGTVSTGATVSGFGLAFTNTVGGTNALNVVNDGAIVVTAPNIPSAGGTPAALSITAIGATPVNYSGAGSITNNGLGGTSDGLRVDANGTGNVTLNVGGNISTLSASAFNIWVNSSGTAGNIAVTTAVGTTLSAGAIGIVSFIGNAANAGTTTIINNAAITSRPLSLNTLAVGIDAFTNGTGALSVTNNGAIGSATDRSTGFGINAGINNAASTAALGVDGSGAIFTSGTGISAVNSGIGTTTVNYTGAIDSTGTGISASLPRWPVSSLVCRRCA